MEVRDDGASFLPLLIGLEVDNAVRDGEVFAEAPFVSRSEACWHGGGEMIVDVGWCEVW